MISVDIPRLDSDRGQDKRKWDVHNIKGMYQGVVNICKAVARTREEKQVDGKRETNMQQSPT